MAVAAPVVHQMCGVLEGAAPTTCCHFIATILTRALGTVVGGALTDGLDTPYRSTGVCFACGAVFNPGCAVVVEVMCC